MKKLLKLTLVAALALTTTATYAQKYARINLQEVVSAMPEFKEMQENLDAFGKDLQEQLEQIVVEFNNLATEFQKNQASMTESVRQMKQQQMEQVQQRYNEFQRLSQEDYQKKSAELFEPVQKKANEAVAKIAKSGGYVGVFDTSLPTLAYFDEAALADIAPAVRKALGITDAPTK